MKYAKSDTHSIDYISFASVVSAFSVLILHTNVCFWQFSSTESYWKSANVIECLFYYAVPVFFMISGVTLMDFYDKYSLKSYFIKRLKKTGVPFIIWSIIGLVFQVLRGTVKLSDITIPFLYEGIVNTSIIKIYWFFKPLFIVYMCLPLFAAVDKSRRKTVFSYLVVAGFFLNNVIPFVKTALDCSFTVPFNLPVVSEYLIYPLIGWLIHNVEIDGFKKKLLYFCSLLGLLAHIFGTYILSMRAGGVISVYKGYTNVPCLLYSTGVFVFLKDFGSWVMFKSDKCKKLITVLASYTFEIYLLQFFMLEIVPHISIINTKSLIYRLGAPFIMVPIIVVITSLMRRLPIVRNIVP